ncbi:hypothetical protein SSX86_027192 [Deinandra increscens subsp. villosa]|uniref:Peptide chain release factor domain-containing protein n=1 Tax=Deinandra increscens subsp. villosa TaxID=3103831 RepID=A0AAP0CFW3_9ASTR
MMNPNAVDDEAKRRRRRNDGQTSDLNKNQKPPNPNTTAASTPIGGATAATKHRRRFDALGGATIPAEKQKRPAKLRLPHKRKPNVVLSKDADVDEEMAEMIASEIESLSNQLLVFEEKLKMLLIPSDPLDTRNILLEVRAGTGGEEAGRWAADLVRMYQRYAERNSLKYSPLSCSEAERGGYKTYVMEVKGARVYSKLKYESGVHRVQRVPQTEAQGQFTLQPLPWPSCQRYVRMTGQC